MKQVFIFLVCLCCAHLLQAQKAKVEKGYVVTLKKDTLRGLVEDRIDKELISGVSFYGDDLKLQDRYSAGEILEFKTGNRIFRPFSLTDSTHQFGKLVNEGTLTFLVSYKEDKFIYFVRNSSTGKSATLQQADHVNTRQAKFLYLNNLFTVANLPADITKTKPIPFSEEKLRKFVTDYNNETNSTTAKVYEDNIVRHNILTVGMIKYNKVKGVGYTLSYFFSKENQDRRREGLWIHGIRYESISPQDDFYAKRNRSILQLLPIGYRYSPRGTKVKPYLLGLMGIEFIREKKQNFSNSSTHIYKQTWPIGTIGCGVSVNVGEGNLILESTLAPLRQLFRFSIGYDFAK